MSPYKMVVAECLSEAYGSALMAGCRVMDESKRVEPDTMLGTEGDLDAVPDSPALRRLIEEVRYEESGGVPRSYNRTFNRHNR